MGPLPGPAPPVDLLGFGVREDMSGDGAKLSRVALLAMLPLPSTRLHSAVRPVARFSPSCAVAARPVYLVDNLQTPHDGLRYGMARKAAQHETRCHAASPTGSRTNGRVESSRWRR